MSVVTVRVYKNRIDMAADSICVRGGAKMNNSDRKMTKLFRYKDTVVGGVGRAEENSLFQRYMKSHILKEVTEDGVIDFLIEFSKWKKDLCNDANIDNSYLIASKGKVFYTNGLFVVPIDDYYAIGAGEDFARGAMYVGATPEEAVKVACDLCVYVSEPIITESIPIDNM